jgi:diguanylate cyclase (GGDEF)-like protein
MIVDTDKLLEIRKIEVLFDQAPVAISAGTIAAFICMLVFWGKTDHIIILATWASLYLLVYITRYYHVIQFNQSTADARKHGTALRLHLVFSSATGLLWAGLSIYLLASVEIDDSLIVLLVLGGLIAGVVATNSVILKAFFAFSLPAALPVIAWLFLQGASRTSLFGLVFGIFLAFISYSAYKLNKLVIKSLAYQFENLKLLDALQNEKNQVNLLYSNLEFDLARRKKAEDQLKLEKVKAEQMAESLLAISTLDGLTGIPNRRHFDSAIAKEWNRASRTGTPISLIMCDIDKFKAYNDNYGHQKGDNTLIRIATLLQEHARRGGDMAARYGGEEFVIILPTTSLENAREIAEQMRTGIEELSIPHRYSDTDNIVTASFGVATIIPRPEQQPRILISRADKAMYQAKQKGSNCVVVADPVAAAARGKAEDDEFGQA